MKFTPILLTLTAVTLAPASAQLPALENFGQNPDPVPGRYPLKMCQGNCMRDEHCGVGLMCGYRGAGTPVPGCSGTDDTATNYCITDPNFENTGENGAEVLNIQVVGNADADVTTATLSEDPRVDAVTDESSGTASSTTVLTAALVGLVVSAVLGGSW